MTDDQRAALQRKAAEWVRKKQGVSLARIRAATDEQLIEDAQVIYRRWSDNFGAETESILGPFPTELRMAARVLSAATLLYSTYLGASLGQRD